MIDLKEWTYLFTFGYTLDIYANLVWKADDRGWFKWRRGCLRLGIDRLTGKKVISYVV